MGGLNKNNVNKTKRPNRCKRTSISSRDFQIIHDLARSKSPYFSDKTLINLFSVALVFNLCSFQTKGGFGSKFGGGKGGN